MHSDRFTPHRHSPLDPPTQLLKFLCEEPNRLQVYVIIGVENAHQNGHINHLHDCLNEFWPHYFSKQFPKAVVVAVSLVQPEGLGTCDIPAIVSRPLVG